MSVTLRDPTDRLLDLPIQPLGPQPQRQFHVDSKGSTVFTVVTDRGRGEFPRPRRDAHDQVIKSMRDPDSEVADKILYRSKHFPVIWGSRSRRG